VSRLNGFPGAAVATVLGSGFCPVAPGTAGSIVSSFVFWLVRSLFPVWVEPASLALILPLSMWGCKEGYRLWGHDPSRVNVDEFAGCWIACLAVPSSWGVPGIASALVIFRLFDILKPWPVSYFDRMKTPAGILLDDVAAGILSAILIVLGVIVHANFF